MSRTLRPYMPGAYFHICARTQSRIHWFEEDAVKDAIIGFAGDAVEANDVELNAFVVMDNHFHLIIRQASMPIGRFMHPIMRRTALFAKRRYGLDDHVFGGPFRHRVCVNASDLRNCVDYVHRNPVRAGLCNDPGDYPWSSHNAYALDLNGGRTRPRMSLLRDLFVPDAAFAIDAHASRLETELFAHAQPRRPPPRKRKDLADIVRDGIQELCSDCDLEMVRTFRGSWIRRVRQELVRRASLAGHPGMRIAAFLQMSEASVSRIVSKIPVNEKVEKTCVSVSFGSNLKSTQTPSG